MTDLSLAFTDKDITPWAGLALLKRLCDHLGFFEQLSHIGLPEPGSNRGYQPEQLITQLLMSVWCGANRFEHCEVTRADKTLANIFGWLDTGPFPGCLVNSINLFASQFLTVGIAGCSIS
jgi:hypothetical protein